MFPKLPFWKTIPISATCLLGLSALASPMLLASAPTPASHTAQVMPPLDEDDKPQTTPAGPRDDCLVGETSQPLLPLLPDFNEKIGLTVSPYPTLFVYVPETRAESAQFVLSDEAGREVYSQTVTLADTAGVMSLTVPAREEIAPLAPGETYSWTFALACPNEESGGTDLDLYVTGWIQRVENPELKQQVEQASARQVFSLCVKAGIWHDMLHALAELRRDNPQDSELTEYWVTLLTDVGLAPVAQAPLMDVNPEVSIP